VRIQSTGKPVTTTKKDKVVEFETFTVTGVEAGDLGTTDRMTDFVAKFGHLVGITHDDLSALPGAVAARYADRPGPAAGHAG
jgi:hypothetical protein